MEARRPPKSLPSFPFPPALFLPGIRYSRLEFARKHFMFGTVSQLWFCDLPSDKGLKLNESPHVANV
jgi:hypothetical protein